MLCAMLCVVCVVIVCVCVYVCVCVCVMCVNVYLSRCVCVGGGQINFKKSKHCFLYFSAAGGTVPSSEGMKTQVYSVESSWMAVFDTLFLNGI